MRRVIEFINDKLQNSRVSKEKFILNDNKTAEIGCLVV